MKRFINGWFEQGAESKVNEGPDLNERNGYFTFSGVLTEDGKGRITGVIHDRFGTSDVEGEFATAHSMKFRKRYRDRTDVIEYTYVLSTNSHHFWVGGYYGKATGSGRSKLILGEEIPAEFFNDKE